MHVHTRALGALFSILLAALGLLFAAFPARSQDVTTSHAFSILGEPKYGPGYAHFDYANPDAPKGGELRQAALGTFNNFNPLVLKGHPDAGFPMRNDPLMVTPEDDPYTLYGLIAESVETPADSSWVLFHIDPRARFSDGRPITAQDVVFSFNALNQGFGNAVRSMYRHVASVAALDQSRVRFDLQPGTSREMIALICRLTVFPKHYWEKVDVSKTSLVPPVGSGPYRIKSFKPGREIVYERVKDYWAKDHPARAGQYNFDIVRYDYFRDDTVALEAFKAGLYDVREELSAKNWATLYTGPAFDSGAIRTDRIPHQEPLGIEGLFFNLRRPLFQDPRVRQALTLAFDYQWINHKLFFGQYPRNTSFFSNSPLACRGIPEGAELQLLEPFRDDLPPELFLTPPSLPGSPGDGFNRANLIRAARLLQQAGYALENNVLIHRETGQELRFTLLTNSSIVSRVALPFQQSLARLGVDMRIHLADSPQFIHKLNHHDYDMIASAYGHQLIPGREELLYWHSSADMADGRNLIGVARPEVDALAEALVEAESLEEMTAAGNALDRVLLWGGYVIPLGSTPYYRLVWWDRFGRPAIRPAYDLGLHCWWEETPLEHPTPTGGE